MATGSGDDGAAGAVRAGADLRAARERLGWELPAVAAGLRDPARLSRGARGRARSAICPAPPMRSASCAPMPRRSGSTPTRWRGASRPRPPRSAARPSSTFPPRCRSAACRPARWRCSALVLAIGAYAGWYRLSGEGRLPAEVGAAGPERLAAAGGAGAAPAAAARPPPRPADGAGAPPLRAPSRRRRQRRRCRRPDDAAPVPPSSAAAMPMPPRSGAAPAQSLGPRRRQTPAAERRGRPDRAACQAPTPGAGAQNAAAGAAEPRAATPARAGRCRPRPDLLLTTGNAGGTELVVDGVAAPALGGSGAVRRDLPLDPDAIKDGKLPAQIQACGSASRPRRLGASPRRIAAAVAAGGYHPFAGRDLAVQQTGVREPAESLHELSPLPADRPAQRRAASMSAGAGGRRRADHRADHDQHADHRRRRDRGADPAGGGGGRRYRPRLLPGPGKRAGAEGHRARR